MGKNTSNIVGNVEHIDWLGRYIARPGNVPSYNPDKPFEQTKTPGRWKDAQRVVWRIEDMDSAYIRNAMVICLEHGNYTKHEELEAELKVRGEQIDGS